MIVSKTPPVNAAKSSSHNKPSLLNGDEFAEAELPSSGQKSDVRNPASIPSKKLNSNGMTAIVGGMVCLINEYPQ